MSLDEYRAERDALSAYRKAAAQRLAQEHYARMRQVRLNEALVRLSQRV
jgi:hypothetical protein